MKRLLVVGTLLCVLSVHTFSQPKRIRVPQDQPTIRAGINAALNGDTVLVADGTYYENLKIAKKIVLGSLYMLDADTSHVSKTIIDGSTPSKPDSATVIIVTTGSDTNTVIVGLTIRKGKGTHVADSTGSYTFGGGIIVDAGGATIRKNIITENSIQSSDYLWGAGISVGPMLTSVPMFNFVVEDNVIKNNTLFCTAPIVNAAEGAGADLWAQGRFRNNVVVGNTVFGVVYGAGGGVAIGGATGFTGPTIDFSNNIVRDNVASHWGGAMIMYIDPSKLSSPSITMTNNIITSNNASVSGAAIVINGGNYTLINNTFAGNVGPQAVQMQSGRGVVNLRLLNNILWNPSCPSEITTSNLVAPLNIFGLYNDVRGGLSGGGNFNSDPLFVANDSLYRLTANSPCIGAGAASASVSGPVLNAPVTDYLKSARPRPVSSNPDLGAIENDAATAPTPSAPTLAAPANGDTAVALNVVLRWRPSNSSTMYHIQVATDSGFASSIVNDSTMTDTLKQMSSLSLNTKYYWHVRAKNSGGASVYSSIRNFKTGTQTRVDKVLALPTEFALRQNYPNPFNPVTTLEFSIPLRSNVRLSIYDLLGREVETLVNEEKLPGTYRATWDASRMPSGVYLYRLQAANFVETKKLVLLR